MFPLDLNATKATFDIQYGNIERPTHFNTSWDIARFESVGHKWVDISEDNYGVSLLNDSKYGHSVIDNEIGLTLIKSGIEPNKEADREEHYFTYSLYPHINSWKESLTHQMAYSLNTQLYCVIKDKQEGILPNSNSFISINKDNIIVEVVKKAEDDNSIILRLYECFNRRENTKITLWNDINEAFECDMLENIVSKLEVSQTNIWVDFKPFEIKTIKVIFNK